MSTIKLTPFQEAIQSIEVNKLSLPAVSIEGNPINYIKYQLATHKFNLALMANGMKFRHIKFTDIKRYYGLKGRSAKECMPEFLELMDNYINQNTVINN